MYTKNVSVEKLFNTRITNILKSVFIKELGDFENSSVEIVRLVGGAGEKTIKEIEKVIKENHIETLDFKIEKLLKQKQNLKEFIIKKRRIGEIEYLQKIYKNDIKYFKKLEKELKELMNG